MTIRRIEAREIRQAGGLAPVAPAGLAPVLRASWGFAHKWARRFNQELLRDRVADFLKKVVKRFSNYD